MASYRRIARIIRVKGLAGELVVACAPDASLCVDEGLRVWVVPPDHDLVRETRVRSVAESGEDGDHLLLSLDGVADRTTAQRLQGRYLLASADDVDDARAATGALGAMGAAASALGLTVIDMAEGLVGTIVEERVGAAQTLWVVDGPAGETLIPAVDEFICARDDQAVHVRLPQGLLGLNS
jgi:16S rRNA processing protein RimM